jgi:hypothetical protein
MTVLKHIKTVDTKQKGQKHKSYGHQNSYYYCYLPVNEPGGSSVLLVTIKFENHLHHLLETLKILPAKDRT